MIDSISNDDLPALYRAADEVSLEGQRKYLRLIKADLFVLLAGTASASFDIGDPTVHKGLLVLSAILLAAAAIITLVLSRKTYKNRWYGGRAAAESAKTLAWRYMMRSEPFDDTDEAEGVDERFTRSLRDVLLESENLALSLHGNLGTAPQISEKMRAVRISSLSSRKQLYVTDRIQDQRTWYSKKSSVNARREDVWFLIVAFSQLLALAAAILMVTAPDVWANPTGVFSTLAAAALAWLQVKQHEELAQSYSVAAHELGLIAEQARHVDNESKFSTFVADAETAISREHTLWLARRDQLLTITSRS